MPVDYKADIKEHHLKTASLFSGVGGLEIATSAGMTAAFFCDSNADVRRVIKKRQQDGNLPQVPVYDDVATIPDEALQEIEAMTAGFPCPDLSIAAERAGMAGTRSGLFRFVVINAAKAKKLKVLILENVGHLVSNDMKPAFVDMMRWLICIDFVVIRWIVLTASAVGKPHERKRWFCLATRRTADLDYLAQAFPGLSPDDIQNLAKTPWETNGVPLHEWLCAEYTDENKSRLEMMGNAVVPLCANSAIRVLANMYVKPVKPQHVVT